MKKILILATFFAVILTLALAFKKKKQAPLLSFKENEAIAWTATWSENNQKHDISLEKRKNIWYVVRPFFVKSDQAETLANVKNFLSLNVIKSLGKVDEKKYCEQHETFSISYNKKNKKKNFTIKIGKKHPALPAFFVCLEQKVNFIEKMYAWIKRKPLGDVVEKVYLMEEWYALALRKSLDDVIEKDFLRLTPLEIKKVTTPHYTIIKKAAYFYLAHHEKKTDIKKTDKLVQDLGFLQAKRAVTDIKEKSNVMKKGEIVENFLLETMDKKKIALKIYYFKKKKEAYAKITLDRKKNKLFFDLYEIKWDHLAHFSKKKSDFLLN